MAHNHTRSRSRTTAAAIAVAAVTGGALLATTGPAHAGASDGLNIGAAIATSRRCPLGDNAWDRLDNARPTPTCAVNSDSFRLVNLRPAVLHRHPGYGWYPATCTIVSAAWSSVVGGFGLIAAGARVVEDDGMCTGRTMPMNVAVTASPRFANVYGVPAGYFPQCTRQGVGLAGSAVVEAGGRWCGGRMYQAFGGDYERGRYELDVTVSADNQVVFTAERHDVV